MAHPVESHAHDAHHPNYFKIYWILLVLFSISVSGPLLGNKTLTLITAFGIALIKAYLVAANFMHLNVEKRYVVYLLCTALALLGIFYSGVAPDVMNHRGRQWENVAAEHEVDRAMAEAGEVAAHGGEHGHGEHGEP